MQFKRLARPVCYPEQTVECLDDNAASEFVSGSLAAAAISRVETHLAGCRDCRALVAALAGDDADSNAATHKHEKIEDSQVAKRPALSVGDRVGRYLVLATLGSGGMGVVFTAYDPQLDRKVALKLLRGNLGVNAKEARTRLKREAQAIAQLNHPNVVGVYDVGTTESGDVYIAMEFVEGDTLTSWLKKWPRTWREILDVFHQAARGLMAAHSVGLLHRDFKPDNVLVGGDGRVRVTDFGLARSVFLDDSTKGSISQAVAQAKVQGDGSVHPLLVDLTRTGTVLGTPRYMPPEQLTGPTIDARADQFSFCVALYEALWGGHPLEGSTSVSMLEQGVKAKLPTDTKNVPAPLVRAVMRGLEQERQKRFPTMSALMQELTPPPQRSPVRFVAVAAVGALLVTGATAAVIAQRPNPVTRVEPHTDEEVRLLYEEIQKKNKIIEEYQKIIAEQKVRTAEELANVKKQLDAALADTKKLQDEIIKIRSKQVPNAKPIVAEITGGQVTDAIDAVRGSMAFCLAEVESRAASTEGAPKDRHFDAVVRMSTTPSGTAFDVKTTGLDYSPSARLCVEDALKRVAYPKGSDVLDLRVTIAWTGTDLNIGASVVGQHEPTGSNLNGI